MRSPAPRPAGARMVIAVLVMFALHAAFASGLVIGAARPSLSLTALLTASLFLDAETGACLGFVVGLLDASFAARYIGSYIVTRTLAGFLVGTLEERIFRDNVLVAVATVFVGTLFVGTCFFAFAPQPHAVRWFTEALLQAAYNALLAVPTYLLLKRLSPRRLH